MKALLINVLALVAILLVVPARADTQLPQELEGWRDWVLDGQDWQRCPFFAGSDGSAEDKRACLWPGRLELDVNGGDGRFTQNWFSWTDAWIPLPGNTESWPQGVTVNGGAAAVVLHQGIPQLRVTAGSYSIAGHFTWAKRPESVPIPQQSGLVSLTLDGRKIDPVERLDETVWLGHRRDAEGERQLDVQVYRLLRDGVPMVLETQMKLLASGDAREEFLSPVLPAGFVPTSLDSPLPARLDPDGRMRLQVRAGSWMVTLHARAVGGLDKILLAASSGHWPGQEIWGFAADDRLRVAAVEGAEGVDPAQANVPMEWRGFPSFRLVPGTAFRVVERTRGMSNEEGNHLNLRRQLYLDFTQQGLTAIDEISGSMHGEWRLDMRAPFKLLSATSGASDLLVTEGSQSGLSGVELRNSRVSLASVARLDLSGGTVAATGWSERFDHVSGVLHLPPGHRLLAALGTDEAPEAWVERWGLLDLFVLLITTVIMGRVFGGVGAAATFLAVVLVQQEDRAVVWLILFASLTVAGVRLMPVGRLRMAITWVRNLSFVMLIWVVVPFAVTQLRFALYPQLADPGRVLVARNKVAEMSGAPEGEMAEAPAPRVAMAAPAMAPAASYAASAKSMDGAVAVARREAVTSSSTSRYAPGTVVQAGRGRPHWNFVNYAYGWSGPVDASQTVHFLIMGPVAMALWRVLAVVLLIRVVVTLVRGSVDGAGGWRRFVPKRDAAAMVFIVCVMAIHATPLHAATTPDPALLGELKARLTRSAQCLPDCVEILSADVLLKPLALEALLDVSALAPVAVALPSAASGFLPEAVSVDGAAATGVYRDAEQQYWVALKPGVHTVRVNGSVHAADSLQLLFPQVPRAIRVSGEGWEASGTSAGRMLGNTLELVRRHAVGAPSDTAYRAAQFAPFVRVHRQFMLDLDWSVQNTVERLAPEKGGFTLEIPRLTGESILTEGIEQKGEGGVVAAFDSTATEVSWRSSLPTTTTLQLRAPPEGSLVEVWSFKVSPLWRVTFAGVPEVLPAPPDIGEWSFDYFPRPGETLALVVVRPAPIPGETFAIDDLAATFAIGKRSTDGSLQFSYRSTQGGRHGITLPLSARVTAVTVDGVQNSVRPDKGQLPLALLPGTHRVQVHWQADGGVAALTRTPAIDMHIDSSNVLTEIEMPADRWVLYAGGAGIGPAILYWGELLVFIVVAVALGRVRGVSLRTHEWLLLGLGLSTFSWSVFLLFVAWMFALRWRAHYAVAALANRTFNVLQAALIGLSVSAIVALVAAIPHGLLATPDMRVAGVGQSTAALNWFSDHAPGLLPSHWVLSVSLWWYKLAMLLWALWLALALAKWLPMAWRVLSVGGIWRRRRP